MIREYQGMDNVAIGVVMFNRVSKLASLLDSAEKACVGTVYVADNGRMTAEKEELYTSEFEFTLEVIDLEYDAGVGACRRELSHYPSEEYILLLDSDMEVPENYEILFQQLDSRPDIGGISGLLIEEGRIYTSAVDLYEENKWLVKDIRRPRDIQQIARSPLAEFDFIPQVGAFRRECLTDYSWDEFYRTQREHIDFFVGHIKMTDWSFAICPEVYFRHYPGGSDDYQIHRQSEEKRDESKRYFREKWGYKGIKNITNTWIDTYDPEKSRFGSPNNYQLFIKKVKTDGLWEASKSAVQFGLRKLNR